MRARTESNDDRFGKASRVRHYERWYKVLAEDKGMRVILATWQPGQRDQWHAHPVMAVYWLAGCNARVYSPNGTFLDVSIRTGEAAVQRVIESHSFENRADSECKAIMVERE